MAGNFHIQCECADCINKREVQTYRGKVGEKAMTEDVLQLVRREREHQDAKWGVDVDPTIERIVVVLMEEVGELAEALLNNRFHGPHSVTSEAIQVAAVAVKIVEAVDRGVR
jgi:NTP pyrophosphatase (non-canonical NTP hydrolase)